MEMELALKGKSLGKLVPTASETREVPVETLPWYVKTKPKSVTEEVVVQLSGKIELPADRQELLLIHRNIVDGTLDKLYVGTKPEQTPENKTE